MNFSIIITAYKEPQSIRKAIESIIEPNLGFFGKSEIIIIAPDQETLDSASDCINKFKLPSNSYKLIKDGGKGKPAALNTAVKQAKGKILFLTDGDMYVSENAISEILPFFSNEKIGGVSGRPASLDDRSTRFGFYSHLFCEAANIKRLKDRETPMSGYLYAIRNLKDLFPIPEEIRAEDAYISRKLQNLGYKTEYAPEAIAYVHFPKNTKDWINQKKRSLGGNVQLASPAFKKDGPASRSMREDLKMAFFPFRFSRNLREYIYSILLYPLRLYLWIIIYLNHNRNKYESGMWQRIESSKY